MKKEFEALDLIIYVLWTLIIIFILLNLCFDFQNFILVGLAGLLASASVMKNIENTNKIEEQKVKRELFDRRKKIISKIEQLKFSIDDEGMYLHEIEDIELLRKRFNGQCGPIKNNFDPTDKKNIETIKEIVSLSADSEFIFDKKDMEYLKPFLENLYSYFQIISLLEKGLTSEDYPLLGKEETIRKEILSSIPIICTKLKDSIKLV